MTEIRVEILERASGSMVAFTRDPETRRVVVLLRLRPVMSVDEVVHEAAHVAQVAKTLEAGQPLTCDLAAELEKEVRRCRCNSFPGI